MDIKKVEEFLKRIVDFLSIPPGPKAAIETSVALSAIAPYLDLFPKKQLLKKAVKKAASQLRPGHPLSLAAIKLIEGDKTGEIPLQKIKALDKGDLGDAVSIQFLYSLGYIHIPEVDVLIDEAIKKEKYHSKLFHNDLILIYLISRVYKGKLRGKIINYLIGRLSGLNSLLDKALAATSLLNLGVNTDTIQGLIKDILDSPDILFMGERGAFLRAALAAETILKYEEKRKSEFGSVKDQDANLIYKEVIELVRAKFMHTDRETNSLFDELLESVLESDIRREIALGPYFFDKSLEEELNGKISREVLKELGAANVFGWLAYKIYDDFLNYEGDSAMLSIANIANRESIKLYCHILKDAAHLDIILRKMDKTDMVNQWEVLNCRFDPKDPTTIKRNIDYEDYSVLYRKSSGRSLPSISIILLLGFNAHSLEIEKTRLFFKHYLIASSLENDADDWEKDMRSGIMNPAISQILQGIEIAEWDSLDTIIAKMRHKFALQDAKYIYFMINEHIYEAKRALEELEIMADKSYFISLLDRLEKAVSLAVKTALRVDR